MRNRIIISRHRAGLGQAASTKVLFDKSLLHQQRFGHPGNR